MGVRPGRAWPCAWPVPVACRDGIPERLQFYTQDLAVWIDTQFHWRVGFFISEKRKFVDVRKRKPVSSRRSPVAPRALVRGVEGAGPNAKHNEDLSVRLRAAASAGRILDAICVCEL